MAGSSGILLFLSDQDEPKLISTKLRKTIQETPSKGKAGFQHYLFVLKTQCLKEFHAIETLSDEVILSVSRLRCLDQVS